jgi:hypothetical protein
MFRSLLILCCFGLLSCGATSSSDEAGPLQSTKDLFAFAPKDTELGIAIRDLDLVQRNGAALLQFLSGVPSIRQRVEDWEAWGDEKMGKSPLDNTFLSSLALAPEKGGAVFFSVRDGQPRRLTVIAIRELKQFVSVFLLKGRRLYGEELQINKRPGKDGEPELYDVKPGAGSKLPSMVFAHRDGYVLLSEQEAAVREAYASQGNIIWGQVEDRSGGLSKESHDALIYFSLDGASGQQVRANIFPVKGVTDSWRSVVATGRLVDSVLLFQLFVSAPDAKGQKQYFERNGGRGDILSIAGNETVSTAKATLHAAKLWQKFAELPVSSSWSALRLGELFQSATGLRLSDPEEGVLDNLTGELAYVSGPGVVDFAVLFGIKKPEPFEKLMDVFWAYAKSTAQLARPELEKDGITVGFVDPREEAGRKIYRAEIRQKNIPIPFSIEAGVTSDSVIFGVGKDWVSRASARAGKGASPYYRTLLSPETRKWFEQNPELITYIQFLDPFEGLESTPGEMSQVLSAYMKDPNLGETLEITRMLTSRLFDMTAAFSVRDDGFLWRLRFTMM